MKKALLSISIMLIILSQPVFSHMGGHGPVSEKEAIFIASQISKQFIGMDPGLGFGKLNESWKNVAEDKQRVYKAGEGYYIISIENSAEQTTLYILMSIQGEVYDANFSGLFPGLK